MRLRLFLLTLSILCLSALAEAAPPTVEVGAVPAEAEVGRTFDLPLTMRWEGAERGVQILGVDLGAASPFTQGKTRHSERRKGDAITHTLTVSLTPTLPGDALLGPLALLYQEGPEGEALRLDLPGTYKMRIAPAVGAGGRGALLLGLAGVAGLAVFWLRRRGGANAPGPSDVGEQVASAQVQLEAAQRYASRGEWDAALGMLLALRRRLAPEEAGDLPSVATLQAALERIHYGGVAADDQEIRRWIRGAERALGTRQEGGERRRGDPDAA